MSSSLSGAGRQRQDTVATAPPAGRSPLAHLLHALNQPLTGLQCSMEVALAGPRTAEQYVAGLREGLELTGRMRALVGAIREVVEAGEETEEKKEKNKNKNEAPETAELNSLLREVVDDLQPMAEAKGVRIRLECAGSSLAVNGGQQKLSATVFRFLEAALSLADGGSALEITSGGSRDEAWIRLRWRGRLRGAEFSRPELGLLVAQAVWESVGGRWERRRTENLETVTVRLPGVPAQGSVAADKEASQTGD